MNIKKLLTGEKSSKEKTFFQNAGKDKGSAGNSAKIFTPSPTPMAKEIVSSKSVSPDMQDFFSIVTARSFDLSGIRELLSDLEIEDNGERKIFKNLSTEECRPYSAFLKKQESLLWEKYVQDLPENDPESICKLKDFNSNELLHPVIESNLEYPNSRFTEKVLNMFEAAARELRTVHDVDRLFQEHNGNTYFIRVDDQQIGNSEEPWMKILLTHAGQIAERDMEPHLEHLPKDASELEVEKFYRVLQEAESILQRKILPHEIKSSFLQKFQSVLEGYIDYFHKYSKTRTAAGYLCRALDIKHHLYEQPIIEENSEPVNPEGQVSSDPVIEEQSSREQPVVTNNVSAKDDDKIFNDRVDNLKQKALSTAKNPEGTEIGGGDILHTNGVLKS